MKIRRIFLFTMALVPAGIFAMACGDDDVKTIYIAPDSSFVNDGDAACEPITVPESNFNSVDNQPVCSDEDLETVILACSDVDSATSEDCAKVHQTLAACASCVVGLQTDPNAHPGYQYNEQTVAIPSTGACMLAIAKTQEDRDCAVAYGVFETCAFASCLTPCIDDVAHIDECIQTAGGTTCTKGVEEYNKCQSVNKYDDDTFGVCTSRKTPAGADLTESQFYYLVAQAYCGKPQPDGGVPEGGTDAGADAGDADADAK